MTSLLFDSPIWFLILLTGVGLGLLFTGVRRGHSNMRTTGVALIALAALLFVFRITIETDEKRIEKQTRAMIEAIAKNDWNAAGPYLRHATLLNFQGEELAAHAKERCERYGLTDVKVSSLDIERQPNVYVVKLGVTSYHKGQFVESVPSVWSLEYQKRGQGWVLTNLVPISIGVGNMVRPEDIIGGR